MPYHRDFCLADFGFFVMLEMDCKPMAIRPIQDDNVWLSPSSSFVLLFFYLPVWNVDAMPEWLGKRSETSVANCLCSQGIVFILDFNKSDEMKWWMCQMVLLQILI